MFYYSSYIIEGTKCMITKNMMAFLQPPRRLSRVALIRKTIVTIICTITYTYCTFTLESCSFAYGTIIGQFPFI